MPDLSILIPARNEMFLARTVADILENIEGDTEVIVVLDGQAADPPIALDPRVTIVSLPQSVGQRAATNLAARLSKAKYVAKCDAHCAFDKGFDVKLMKAMEGHDDWTVVPVMRNLHAFNWVCKAGHRRYQSPSGPCETCGEPTEREVCWIAKESPQSKSYRFDNTLHFQYFGDFNKRPEGQGDITPTMSLQGSFFMLTREKYWELNICDEAHGSWGQQGVEVACKTWLSGGEVMCVQTTWYAHLFRTQGGDFGFPYPNPGSEQEKARKYSRDLWLNNKWPLAKHKLQWLIDKFAPVPGWDVSVGAIYYTDNELDPKIMKYCQEKIKEGMGNNRLVSVSLKPLDFGSNIVLDMKRGYLTMFKQILAGLKELDTDIVFFLEHDVAYHPSHFDFVPEKEDVYYYNTNVWKMNVKTGHAMRTDNCQQLSGLCGYRKTLIKHYEERVRRVESEGFSVKMGFEPGTHNRPERVDDLKAASWESEQPNIDIRHAKNLTPSRWSKDEFRNQVYTKGWREAEEIPGWGLGKNIIMDITND